jgi:hypothetical protein
MSRFSHASPLGTTRPFFSCGGATTGRSRGQRGAAQRCGERACVRVRRLALGACCREAGRVNAPDSNVHASGSLLDYGHGAEGVVAVGGGPGHALTIATPTQNATHPAGHRAVLPTSIGRSPTNGRSLPSEAASVSGSTHPVMKGLHGVLQEREWSSSGNVGCDLVDAQASDWRRGDIPFLLPDGEGRPADGVDDGS